MPKKEEKKEKGKKKKKEKEKETGLSNLERKIYLLTVSEFEHKIEWRNHMRAIIEEDLNLFEEKLQLQQKDKNEVLKLLEDSIEEQRELTQKILRVLPDVESAKSEGEEKRSQELGAKLMQMNQQRLSNDAELEVLRKKLNSLESYSPNKIEEKIKDIEKQLEAADSEDVFLKEDEQDIRRKETFRKEMRDILQKEADSFQIEITGKLDKSFERIIEETRWWADTVNGLRIESERLEAINDTASTKLQNAQRKLKQRKTMSFRESKELQERKAFIKDITRSNKELESLNRDFSQRQENINVLDRIAENLKQNLDSQDNYLMKCLNQMKRNEIELKNLEENLSNEISFGNQLKDYIEKAQQLIAEEVKQSLILTHNGPPERKNTVEEMRCLFEEATRFIYERNNKSRI